MSPLSRESFFAMPVERVYRVLREASNVVRVYRTAPRNDEGGDRLIRALEDLGRAWDGEDDKHARVRRR